MKYEITAEMHLRNFIDESREVAQALNEFADNLERIEKKYTKSQETETWNGYHGQVTVPKGTFQKIWEEAESEE